MRIDDVKRAARDNSGMVLADSAVSSVLEVRCTVIGRVRIVACENLEAWRVRSDEYLVADVEAYDDDDDVDDASDIAAASAALAPIAAPEEAWWMGAAAAGDVADALYRLVDELLALAAVEGSDAAGGTDVDAAVESLERAAARAEDEDWWGALDVWQVFCATRLAASAALHRAERNEFIIDAKLRQGGEMRIPVQEWTLEAADRAKLADLDARARDAVAQMGVDDIAAFQDCLEARRPSQRAAVLLRGVEREAERLARRAALRRALDASE